MQHNRGVMPTNPRVFFELSRVALRTTQAGLGEMLGISRRTAQRWTRHQAPASVWPQLARLVHPNDPQLAAELAAAAGTTLEALGLVDAAPSGPADGVVDAVVCAAADAMAMVPRDVRVGLHAAFARAKDLRVTVEMLERALRVQLQPSAAKGSK
jgi:hypothetical protein